ncbi:fibronectin type III domain-containing protein [Cellvibrio mixtus]|nr:fibronectin type III domain-containing protein [Cellvibrio mixtus]
MKISILSAIVISVLMVGCGGSSSGKKNTSSASSLSSSSVSVSSISSAETSSAQSSSLAPVATGIFLDAAVANIGYRTATQEGFTSVNGEFNYRLGELITFFIGGLELPSVVAAEIITPLEIANAQSLEDNQVINILRLLQSLDKDGDASNGIEITAEAIAAGTVLDFTVAPEVFAELPAVKALLQAAGSANQELIPAEQAVAHFQTTLELINGPSSSSSSNSSSQSSVIVVEPEPSSSSASSTPVVVEPSSSSVSSTPVVIEPSSSSASSTPVVVVPSSSSASSEPVVSSASVSSAPDTEVPGGSSSSVSSEANGLRPAKMEGFAAHAGVTGGAGGPVITVTTGTELNAALCGVRNGNRTAPVTIMVNGTINHGNTTAQGCDTQSDVIEIKKTSNVSIIGVGTNALFDEIGIHVRDASNIIIQNVHIRNVKKSGSPTSNGGDAIGMETNVDRVWIDHNWLEASGGEKDGYDSLLDMKSGVTNVTVSYNLFNDSSRAGLVGYNDSDTNTNITFHHNWYKNIEQRTPLIRNALVHVYNNYWSNPTQTYMIHAINSRADAQVLVESNYFYNVNNPLIASKDSPTPGCWQTNNDNTVLPTIYYSRTVENGQAWAIPAVVDGQLQSTCEVSVPYTVTMDAANDVPAIVVANAGVGKIDNGGDSGSSSSATSSSNSSEASSDQSSSASSVGGAAGTLNESFDVDKATLFSATYQSISTDPTAARYFITGGGSGITVSNNELTINGGRFTIGHRPPRTATTAADTTANGDFDLSRPYRISFNVVAASGAGKMQVYVDNNTTSQGNSIHAAASKVFEAVASTLTAGQLIEITPAVGTPTSFIAFRTESSASVTIDNLKLEYLDEGSSGSSESSAGGEESSSSSSVSSEDASSSSSAASSEVESSASESSVSSEAESSSSSVASSESSSEESSSSSSAGIINTQLPINENFDNVVDAAGFFSVAYKALATDEVAFYHGLSGAPTFANGEITLGNARFTLGNTTPTVLTTSGDTETTGELDLSQPYRISFCVKATQGAGNFQVFVNNNTTGQGNSIHGNSSRIYSGAVSAITVGQRLVINSTVGDTTSFIALRAESTAQVTIDDLWIGYQADTSTEPAAETCVAPTPAAPNAPVVTAGDQQLSVSWSAVIGATSYEVIYNTVDSTDSAVAFENNPVTGTNAVITGLTNNTPYFVFVRAVNANGSSEYSVSASGTPVAASEEPEEPATLILLNEEFNVDKTTLFSATYQSISTDTSAALYFVTGGNSGITIANNELTISAARFTIGHRPPRTNTTASDVSANGDFDLSRPYRISFNVVASSGAGKKLQVYVDNNGTSSGNSLHGANSKVYEADTGTLIAGQLVEIIPTVGTATSFIAFRTETGASITIDNLKLEYLPE